MPVLVRMVRHVLKSGYTPSVKYMYVCVRKFMYAFVCAYASACVRACNRRCHQQLLLEAVEVREDITTLTSSPVTKSYRLSSSGSCFIAAPHVTMVLNTSLMTKGYCFREGPGRRLTCLNCRLSLCKTSDVSNDVRQLAGTARPRAVKRRPLMIINRLLSSFA